MNLRPDPEIARQAARLLTPHARLDLGSYRGVANVLRYDAHALDPYAKAADAILYATGNRTGRRENILLWGSPGIGKNSFIEDVSRIAAVEFLRIDFTNRRADVQKNLTRLADHDQTLLVHADEFDAPEALAWACVALLPLLEANEKRGAHLVFVITGSKGGSLEGLRRFFDDPRRCPKGTDFKSRLTDEFELPPLVMGDKLLAFCDTIWRARGNRPFLRRVDKVALCFVLSHPGLRDFRTVVDFASRAIARTPSAAHRLLYDHLFAPGDPDRHAFWNMATTAHLRDKDLYITDSSYYASPPPVPSDVRRTL